MKLHTRLDIGWALDSPAHEGEELVWPGRAHAYVTAINPDHDENPWDSRAIATVSLWSDLNRPPTFRVSVNWSCWGAQNDPADVRIFILGLQRAQRIARRFQRYVDKGWLGGNPVESRLYARELAEELKPDVWNDPDGSDPA